MSPERPDVDAGDSNHQVTKNFEPTLGMTKVPWKDYGQVNSALSRLLRKHSLPYLPHCGVNWAGSEEWTCLEERPKTLLLVIELKERDRHRWCVLDGEAREILREHELEECCYLRYYTVREECDGAGSVPHPESVMLGSQMGQEAHATRHEPTPATPQSRPMDSTQTTTRRGQSYRMTRREARGRSSRERIDGEGGRIRYPVQMRFPSHGFKVTISGTPPHKVAQANCHSRTYGKHRIEPEISVRTRSLSDGSTVTISETPPP